MWDEVSEGRLLELYQYVDVAGIHLFAAEEGAEEANSLDAETGLDISDMTFEEIDYFHV